MAESENGMAEIEETSMDPVSEDGDTIRGESGIEPSRRSQRRGGEASQSSASASRLAAVEALRAARSGIVKRSDQFQVPQEEDVYDVVDEKEYEKIVAQRRAEAGSFVVDDDGLGYVDIGEEEEFYWEGEMGGDEEEARRRRERKRRAINAGERRSAGGAVAVVAERSRVERMMMARGIKGPGAGARGMSISHPRQDDNSDLVLNDIFTELEGDAGDRKRIRKQVHTLKTGADESEHKPYRAGSQPNSETNVGPQAVQFATKRLVELITSATERHQSKTNTMPDSDGMNAENDYHMSEVGCQDMPPPVANKGLVPEADSAEAYTHESVQHNQRKVHFANEEVGYSSGTRVRERKDEAIKTGASDSLIDAKPSAEIAKQTSLWVQTCQDEDTAKIRDAVMREAAAEADVRQVANRDNLTLDENGLLPFFCVDMGEEAGEPGTVFLFGKVPTTLSDSPNYVSTCVVVRNVERNMFFLPAKGLLDTDSSREALAAYERCISEKADETTMRQAKRALDMALHEAANPAKAEIRDLLSSAGIDHMKIKIVKRSCWFHNDQDIERGEKWVIKVRFVVSDRAVNRKIDNLRDAKGKYFTCIIGAPVSALESLILKSKIMGPAWLLLKGASKESGSRLSFCSLEIVVEGGHKAISIPKSGVFQNRKCPNLSVTALSLATVESGGVTEIAAVSVLHCPSVETESPIETKKWNTPTFITDFTAIRMVGSSFPVHFEKVTAKRNESARASGRRKAVEIHDSERALLSNLMAYLQRVDPDVIVSHDGSTSLIPVLIRRLQQCKVGNWNRLGRLYRREYPKHLNMHSILQSMKGRMLCDTFLSSKEFLRGQVSYALTELARSQLGQQRKELSPEEIRRAFSSSSASLLDVIDCTRTDAWLALALMFRMSVLPLTLQLTKLSGSLWSRTLIGQRAQRIEMLLLHDFHKKKFLKPDPLGFGNRDAKARVDDEWAEYLAHGSDDNGSKSQKTRQKASFKGGLVLEPKQGLYEQWILLLDFNSLYPSIIQEYNICFTTIDQETAEKAVAESSTSDAIAVVPTSDMSPGVLPSLLKRLVERRREVKAMMKEEKDPCKRQQLDIRQQAFKLTANSMYGCLGFAKSRFYAQSLAELITSQGRAILTATVKTVEDQLGYQVVYGDTDSIMVTTGLQGHEEVSKALEIGMDIKRAINRRYSLLELDIDGLFRSLLLLKKKKYAALKVDVLPSVTNPDQALVTSLETKGIDVVRRDWSMLAKNAGQAVLEILLSGRSEEHEGDTVSAIHEYLRTLGAAVRDRAKPLEEFVITKTLVKHPNEYADASSQPHVAVALQNSTRKFNAGHTVPYVIIVPPVESSSATESGDKRKGLASRARHPDDVTIADIDINYYLGQQVHAVVGRLCSVIEGTDSSRLAECLGLDPTKYSQNLDVDGNPSLESSTHTYANTDSIGCISSWSHESTYNNCTALRVLPEAWMDAASYCRGENECEIKEDSKREEGSLPPQPSVNGPAVDPAVLANMAVLQARQHIIRFHNMDVVYDEEALPGRSCRWRDIRLQDFNAVRESTGSTPLRCVMKNPSLLRRQITASHLYKQLRCYIRAVDVESCNDGEKPSDSKAFTKMKLMYKPAANALERIVENCAFKWVSLDMFDISGNKSGKRSCLFSNS